MAGSQSSRWRVADKAQRRLTNAPRRVVACRQRALVDHLRLQVVQRGVEHLALRGVRWMGRDGQESHQLQHHCLWLAGTQLPAAETSHQRGLDVGRTGLGQVAHQRKPALPNVGVRVLRRQTCTRSAVMIAAPADATSACYLGRTLQLRTMMSRSGDRPTRLSMLTPRPSVMPLQGQRGERGEQAMGRWIASDAFTPAMPSRQP